MRGYFFYPKEKFCSCVAKLAENEEEKELLDISYHYSDPSLQFYADSDPHFHVDAD